MQCPECGNDMAYVDYYGRMQYTEHYYRYPRSWIEKIGDIYKCTNDNCDYFQEYFHTNAVGDMEYGYPC